MSRKLAIVLMLLTLVIMVIFDAAMLFIQSGKLEKMIHSIQKFDSLYSQNFRMQQQLLLYSRKIHLDTISKNELKTKLAEFIPPNQIKISGDTLSFKGKAMIDTVKLLELLLKYTNVAVKEMSIDSLIPVKYSGFSYNEVFKEKVVLEKLIIKVYGG